MTASYLFPARSISKFTGYSTLSSDSVHLGVNFDENTSKFTVNYAASMNSVEQTVNFALSVFVVFCRTQQLFRRVSYSYGLIVIL